MNTRIYDEEACRAALRRENGWLLILGESGFEHYLTSPVSLIKASLTTVSLLMLDLEALSWHGHLHGGKLEDVGPAGYEAGIECGDFKPGDPLVRGEITLDLWLSPQLEKFGIAAQARAILTGQLPRLQLNP